MTFARWVWWRLQGRPVTMRATVLSPTEPVDVVVTSTRRRTILYINGERVLP